MKVALKWSHLKSIARLLNFVLHLTKSALSFSMRTRCVPQVGYSVNLQKRKLPPRKSSVQSVGEARKNKKAGATYCKPQRRTRERTISTATAVSCKQNGSEFSSIGPYF